MTKKAQFYKIITNVYGLLTGGEDESLLNNYRKLGESLFRKELFSDAVEAFKKQSSNSS